MMRFEGGAVQHAPAARGRSSLQLVAGGADRLPATAELRLASGRSLYVEGQRAVAPYLVVSGILRVSVALIGGRERLIDIVGPGDVVGTAALEAADHAESVVAAEDGAVVAELDLARVLANRGSRQRLASALVKQLVRSRELADDLGLPMGARICRILARLAERLGEAVSAGSAATAPAGTLGAVTSWRHLPFNLTHDDVALLAGCARVTATRVMGDLKEAGVLDGSRGDYALVPTALLEAADAYVCDVI
ncbi:MAG TPA: Crp/Fnr family transcriptional regulator [Trueperaceae bacterium]|nr:Crp/Fnr family transcriptional regulator [Trueperaceae bacterium]